MRSDGLEEFDRRLVYDEHRVAGHLEPLPLEPSVHFLAQSEHAEFLTQRSFSLPSSTRARASARAGDSRRQQGILATP
jgi:hypothetical protein